MSIYNPDDNFCNDNHFSMTLSLRTTDSDVQTDETSDTFHTAQSNSSFSPSTSHESSNSVSTQKIGNSSSSSSDTKKVTPNHLMMDSGVYVGENSNTQNNLSTDEDSGSCSSCELNSNNNLTLDRPHCSLHILRKKIAAQKAFIMKNLELEIDKVQLDKQISELQDLQKKYFTMEKQLQVKGDHETCCSERKHCDITPSPSTILTTSNNNTFDSPTDDCSIAPSMTRSCPTIGGDNEDETDQFITIPGFVLRGAGKQTHYEYEVRISLADGRLSILRRYSRFRQLHLSMKDCYGAKVSWSKTVIQGIRPEFNGFKDCLQIGRG